MHKHPRIRRALGMITVPLCLCASLIGAKADNAPTLPTPGPILPDVNAQTISQIIVTGSGPIKPAEIRDLIKMKVGSVYNADQFLRDALEIQKLYRGRGYTMSFSPDSGMTAKGVLNVAAVITRVSHITLFVTKEADRKFALHALQTKAGDYYNRGLMQKDRDRIFNTGLFDQVQLEERMAGAGLVDLVIHADHTTHAIPARGKRTYKPPVNHIP